ncbi:DUF3987 domain-containing protein [Lutimonas saemankumensis]|uniref:DUF3987 domain-containing protein n=1 Tax=Lutimonas saemankumensis TaxID=483016 RepID=UPI001CD7585A|nr:DUF3987 domain-containing protein [Lutimonas saemankumensis]MCA0933919.1 DUF3987 domain-containing protein [Lutimonas saemankumensis]
MKSNMKDYKPNNSKEKLPVFPDSLYPQLPQFLQDVVIHASSNQERDMLLLGALTSISSCIPKLYGFYDGEKIYANLYLFVTAPPSSGKGKLNLCKKIILPIHDSLREETEELKFKYKNELAISKINKETKAPKSPADKMLFIPANNSSTGMFQLLSDNDGRGIIFETEGDTVTLALNSDYGNYSDGFRKAFHHETISYYRRTDKEFVEIISPCLSVVLSGTPGQVKSLIPNAENGLFSRFVFYYLDLESDWKDVFKHTSNGLESFYTNLGSQFFDFYEKLNRNNEIEIFLSKSQRTDFHTFFKKLQEKYLYIESDEYIATIRRLGIVAFRFAMIFTSLRIMEDGNDSQKLECSDIDFSNALKMIPVLDHHSRIVFSALPKERKPLQFKNLKEQLLDSLPKKFNRKKYLDIAKEIGINPKTAEGYITKFIDKGFIYREQNNHYINTLVQENKDSKDLKDTKNKSV